MYEYQVSIFLVEFEFVCEDMILMWIWRVIGLMRKTKEIQKTFRRLIAFLESKRHKKPS